MRSLQTPTPCTSPVQGVSAVAVLLPYIHTTSPCQNPRATRACSLSRALITVRATWVPSGLPLDSPWWTERRWWEINGCQNHRKQRPRFLTEKPLRGSRAVCTRQEKVVNCRQACTLGSVTKRLLCIRVQSTYEYKTRGKKRWHCGPCGAIARCGQRKAWHAVMETWTGRGGGAACGARALTCFFSLLQDMRRSRKARN
jgi:hypothetical protein